MQEAGGERQRNLGNTNRPETSLEAAHGNDIRGKGKRGIHDNRRRPADVVPSLALTPFPVAPALHSPPSPVPQRPCRASTSVSISCRELAAHGAKVFMAARSETKAREAIDLIKQKHPDADVHFLELDLTELASVKRAAKTFAAQSDRLDVLLNNAGVMAMPYTTTKDGLEIQVGTNVVGHYLLTMLLLPTLVATSKLPEYQDQEASVRVVQVSSMGHAMVKGGVSFRTLEAVNRPFPPEVTGTWTRYSKSKVGNILIADELKRMLPETVRISSLSVHPGIISSGLWRGPGESYGRIVQGLTSLFAPLFMSSPEQGALTQLYACTSPEVDELKLSGAYLVPTAKVGTKSPLASDPEGKLAGQLFRFCRQFVKDKVDVDVDAVLASAGLETPASHRA
ncbi:hypothetical protein ACQY0O_003944 [Thecaphora frezii]